MSRLRLTRSAGVLVPLFSIYSNESLGIGSLEDLKLLVDWCEKTGHSIIQLLPMNEVGPTNCPYDSISSFALEPMYISTRALKSSMNKIIKAKRDLLKKSLPAGGPHVDYHIKQEKERLLREIFILEEDPFSKKEFKKFAKENSYWLDDFCLYKAIKVNHGQAPWYEWNEGYRNRNSYLLENFAKEHKEELAFYRWSQWQAFKQFKEIKKYANSRKIMIKGDLPILVSRDSADVWAHPEYFKLDFAAGAPPDMYCAKGQRWGAPTYNWESIEAAGFNYIKEKLKCAENFYDILRIDHVVGLFRIWSISYSEPAENKGLNGFFDPPEEDKWPRRGRMLLSVLQGSTSMILCGEDLGMVPKVCHETLKNMLIPGNDVQRWTKDWWIKHDFLEPDEYRKISVAMLSTHDTTNWAAWWENEAGTIDEDLFIRRCDEHGIDYAAVKERLFDGRMSRHGRLRWRKDMDSVEKYLSILGKAPEKMGSFIEMYENTFMEKEKLWKHLKLEGPVREKSDSEIVCAALKITSTSNSVFCVELIFDLLNLAGLCKADPYEYRINRPGTVSPMNWSLTIPISLERLLGHDLSDKIREIITSGRRA